MPSALGVGRSGARCRFDDRTRPGMTITTKYADRRAARHGPGSASSPCWPRPRVRCAAPPARPPGNAQACARDHGEDRRRPAAQRGRADADAPDGPRDPVRAEAGRQQGGQVPRPLRGARRRHVVQRRLGRGQVRRQRPLVRGRPDDRRRHRNLQLGLRDDRDPDPQSRAGRNGQPREHVCRPDQGGARQRLRRARELLSGRRPQLHARRSVRRQRGPHRRRRT